MKTVALAFCLVLAYASAVKLASNTKTLQAAVSKASATGAVDDLLGLIDTVNVNLNKEIDALNAKNQTEQAQCDKEQAEFTHEIELALHDQDVAKECQRQKTAAINEHHRQIEINNQQMAEEQKHLDSKTAERERQNQLHLQKVADHMDAIKVVADIRDQLLQSTLRGSGSGKENSRVQREYQADALSGGHAESDQAILSFMQTDSMFKLERMAEEALKSNNRAELKKAYAAALDELEAAKAAGQKDKVQRILNLLAKLEAALNESKAAYEEEEVKAKDAHDKLVAEIAESRDKLVKDNEVREEAIATLTKELEQCKKDEEEAIAREHQNRQLLADSIDQCYRQYLAYAKALHQKQSEVVDLGRIREIVVKKLDTMAAYLKNRVNHVGAAANGDKAGDYSSSEAQHQKVTSGRSAASYENDNLQAL